MQAAAATTTGGRCGLCALTSALALGLLAAPPLRAADEEFAAFRLTDWGGSVALKGFDDRNETKSDDAGGGQSQTDLRNTLALNLRTQSFFYHPNMLRLDAGAGALFQRSRFRSEADTLEPVETSDGRVLYDLALRAVFLADKPTTGSAYYEHLNPTVSLGPAVVLLQESSRRGLQFSLLEPATPVPASLAVDRTRTTGSGGGRVVDELTDRANLAFDVLHGRHGSTRLRLDETKVRSGSGSVDLPIEPTTSRNRAASLDSRTQFGAEDRYRLTGLASVGMLRYGQGPNLPADRRDARASMDLRAHHAEDLQSFLNAEAQNMDQGVVRSHSRRLAGGATWWPLEGLSTAGELRLARLSTSEYSVGGEGASTSVDYQWAVAGGRAQAGYALRADQRRQNAVAGQTPVSGERHLLPGVAFEPLERLNVVAGSVLVLNETRTQTYVEGRDYLVSVLGAQTRIQRIVAGDIVDGQAVLVDYTFETGGSFDSRQVDQSLGLSWNWSNRLNVYARWFDGRPTLVSGTPTLVLNRVRSRTVGARGEWPLGALFTLGASVEHERRHEDILPLRRIGSEVFVDVDDALLGRGSIHLGLRRQRVAYDDSPQDVDLTGYDLRYSVVTDEGLQLQADWTAEDDVGGLQRRRRAFGSLRARWQFRQLLMTLSATRVRETQGTVTTTRTVGQWLLQRDF